MTDNSPCEDAGDLPNPDDSGFGFDLHIVVLIDLGRLCLKGRQKTALLIIDARHLPVYWSTISMNIEHRKKKRNLLFTGIGSRYIHDLAVRRGENKVFAGRNFSGGISEEIETENEKNEKEDRRQPKQLDVDSPADKGRDERCHHHKKNS